MAARSVRTAGEVPLSKQRVVTESIRLADSEGVDKLSMRRLADELGAGVMSLYYYVANKDELLDAMIDVVFDEIGLPSDRGGWKAAMWQRAMSARRVLGRHPWAITLIEITDHRRAGEPASSRGSLWHAFGRAGSPSRWQPMSTGCSTATSTASRSKKPAFPSTRPRSSPTWARTCTCHSYPPTSTPTWNEAAATLLAAGIRPPRTSSVRTRPDPRSPRGADSRALAASEGSSLRRSWRSTSGDRSPLMRRTTYAAVRVSRANVVLRYAASLVSEPARRSFVRGLLWVRAGPSPERDKDPRRLIAARDAGSRRTRVLPELMRTRSFVFGTPRE